jgi:hypothetical protein
MACVTAIIMEILESNGNNLEVTDIVTEVTDVIMAVTDVIMRVTDVVVMGHDSYTRPIAVLCNDQAHSCVV